MAQSKEAVDTKKNKAFIDVKYLVLLKATIE